MNRIFYNCVEFLKVAAHNAGMTYEEINVWIFCIIGPILFLLLILSNGVLLLMVKNKKQLHWSWKVVWLFILFCYLEAWFSYVGNTILK